MKGQQKAAGAQDKAAKGPPVKGFIVGERVRYWSASLSKWISAHVQRVNHGHGGNIISYDLTAKNQADASRVRAAATPSNAPPPPPLLKVPGPPPPAVLGSGGAAPPCEDYKVGDQVQYWSESKGRWVDARVESRQKETGGDIVYDLSCKKASPPSRMRPQPGAFVVGERVEYWSGGIGQWVIGKVMKVNAHLGRCDLDIKSAAKMGRLRKLAAPEAGEASRSYKTGDRVQYWSETKGRWLEALVEGCQTRRGAKLYDLNCKKGTPVHRLRPSPSGGVAAVATFRVGDRVEYFSSSSGRWLPARVVRLLANLGQCDLDVKQGAAIGRLRHAANAKAPEAEAPPAAKRPRISVAEPVRG